MAPELPGSRRTCPSTEERIQMRRASICLALLGLAVLGIPAAASAAPTVTLFAKAVPIPGFPGTGNILGAGAAVEYRIAIKGTEAIGGVPSQITEVKSWLPAGTKLHPQGFVVAQAATLKTWGPSGPRRRPEETRVDGAPEVDPMGGEVV